MTQTKIFDLTAHLQGNADEMKTFQHRQKELKRLDAEMKRVEKLMEQGSDFINLLLSDGYTEAARKVNRILDDMNEEHSFLSTQWAEIMRTQMGWKK